MPYVRKIVKVGDSDMLVLPPKLLQMLEWGRGDYVQITLPAEGCLFLRKFLPPEISDAVVAAAKALKEISYD